MNQAYAFEDNYRCFVIEQYNERPPFAGFLPGIAGTQGRPAWAFYVNRGQVLASFGVRNKDGAFLEFYPADKAYRLTPSRGFRTFLKIAAHDRMITHEPFQRRAGPDVIQRLYITAHEVGVEEINPAMGIGIRADMFTLPEAPVAGLVRRVEIVNLSAHPRILEVVDGLPQVLPYGLNQWGVKFMSRTSEAFMRVEGVEENRPFYRLKVWPSDTPEIKPVIPGNFFVGFLDGERNRVVVDAEQVFGSAGDLSKPERFFSEVRLDFADQVTANQTPSAFQVLTLELQPGERRPFYGLYGHAPSLPDLDQFLAGIDAENFFEAKRTVNRRLLEQVTQSAFTATASPLFDAHVRQCYLDNGLRGGFPMAVPGGAHLYLFGRKHGDLERDYNDFLLQDTPFSEGNGDFRDVLQNRRLDLFFDPVLGAKNIRYFFNLIQADGYNPCLLRNSHFIVESPEGFESYLDRFPALEKLFAHEFKYADLWTALEPAEAERPAILQDILAQAQEVEDAEFDRGYWSDHWTYLVDLLISYEAVYPDRLHGLFLEKTYTFFDPTHAILPRTVKYVVTARGVRQFGALQARPDKIALIRSRTRRRYRARAQGGHGEVVYTTLLGKILTLVVNKLSSLDPCGVGIEMEADRPGWCDALNGLPGLFGSSVNETIELKRLVDFTAQALTDLQGDFRLPAELAEFMSGLKALLQRPNLTAEDFWRDGGALKEAYRDMTFMGFEGAERPCSIAGLRVFLKTASAYLVAAIAKAHRPEGIITYFAYEAEQYREIGSGRAEVICFLQKPLPLFLEGFVHALRIAKPHEARALYDAVNHSELFDEKLGMYRLNAPLGENALDLGRIGIFNYGWLENGSIFLHMHYKFVLEMVRAGLVEEFYSRIDKLLVAFHDPVEYGRNPAESSSFLVSSGFAVDPRQHGRGCVARLSGSTVELLHLWLHLFLGPAPFVVEQGKLRFRPAPLLSKSFFITDAQCVHPFGAEEKLPAGSAACALFGSTLLVYRNPKRQDTFGSAAAMPSRYRLYGRDGSMQTVAGRELESEAAESLRQGLFRRVEVELE